MCVGEFMVGVRNEHSIHARRQSGVIQIAMDKADIGCVPGDRSKPKEDQRQSANILGNHPTPIANRRRQLQSEVAGAASQVNYHVTRA